MSYQFDNGYKICSRLNIPSKELNNLDLKIFMINYLGNFSVTFSVYNALEKAEIFFKIICFSIEEIERNQAIQGHCQARRNTHEIILIDTSVILPHSHSLFLSLFYLNIIHYSVKF